MLLVVDRRRKRESQTQHACVERVFLPVYCNRTGPKGLQKQHTPFLIWWVCVLFSPQQIQDERKICVNYWHHQGHPVLRQKCYCQSWARALHLRNASALGIEPQHCWGLQHQVPLMDGKSSWRNPSGKLITPGIFFLDKYFGNQSNGLYPVHRKLLCC